MPDLADVVIVGGGIVGTTLAYELSRRNLRVALLETHGLASGTSGSGFAWVNATSKEDDETYHILNAQGLSSYNVLAREWGEAILGLHAGGSLFWAHGSDLEGRAKLRQRASHLQAWNYPVTLLNRGELQALEPQAHFEEDAEGMFAPSDGWVDTPRFLRFLAERIRDRNGELRLHCPATGFTRDITGRISTVETPQGRIGTRTLVLAAGLETPALVEKVYHAPIGRQIIPLKGVPGLLVETPAVSEPSYPLRILYPPDSGGLHLRPTPGGGLLLGADDMDAQIDPRGDFPLDAVRKLLQRAALSFPNLPLDSFPKRSNPRVCVRPVPADERPIVGPLPEVNGVFVVVTHSGVTLAPLLANLLAEEIFTGRVSPLLSSYRPDRFAS